jgi:hypothetical protein
MPSPQATGFPIILGFGTASGNNAAVLYLDAANHRFDLGTWATDLVLGGSVTANTIYHLVGTYDGTTATLYVNGVKIGSVATTFNISLTFFQIGGAGTTFFSGLVDEAALYSSALSATQVAHHYHAGQTVSLPWLTVSSTGQILDPISNTTVPLCGVNTAGFEYGNAQYLYQQARLQSVTTLTHATYWRLAINTEWWNSNVPLPGGGNAFATNYQPWIQTVIGWIKAAGCYVLIDAGPAFTMLPSTSSTQCQVLDFTPPLPLTYINPPVCNPPMSTADYDSFAGRTVSGTWGTSPSGSTWSVSGSPALAVSGSVGTVSGGTPGYMTLGTTSAQTLEVQVHFQASGIATSGGDEIGLLLCYTNTNNFYRARITQTTFALEKMSGGSLTTLATTTVTVSNATLYSFWFFVSTTGSNAALYAEFWDDALTVDYWMRATDTSALPSGKGGIYAFPKGSDTISVDNFYINTPITSCNPSQNTQNFPPWTQDQHVTSLQNFFTSFVPLYQHDPAIFYNAINEPAGWPWTDVVAANKQVLSTIRGLQPDSLVFLYNNSYAQQVIQGSTPDYSGAGLVIDWHIYDGGSNNPWYNKLGRQQSSWTYAQQHGHGFSVNEWNVGGGSIWQPQDYASAIANLSVSQGAPVCYYQDGNLVQGDNVTLTTEGTLVATVYQALRNGASQWYSSFYRSRKVITLLASAVSQADAPLPYTDFPVLISLSDPALKTIPTGTITNSSGYDIIFTDALQASQLPHEIESYDGATGRLLAWVRVPLLSPVVNTQIVMYFGNPAITTSQASPSGVWDSNYQGVWHLSDQGAGSSVLDSTANLRIGTSSAITSSRTLTGIVSRCLSFNGISDKITFGSTSLPTGSLPWTIEAWINSASVGTSQTAVFFGTATTNEGPALYLWTDARAYLGTWNGNNVSSTSTLSNGNWYHVVGTFSGGTNGTLSLYLNGQLQGTLTCTPNVVLSQGMIGSDPSNAWFRGSIDEVRISTIARDAGWIATSYANQSSPSTFYTVGRVPADVPAPYRDLVSASNPIRYYRFDETSLTNLADVASKQSGTCAGTITLLQTSLIAGDADNAILFDGVTGYISVPTTGLPTGGLPWSMEAWVRVPVLASSGTPTIMGFGTSSTNQAALLSYLGSSKQFQISGVTTPTVTGGTILANDTYHVVATYDRVTVCLYVNGVLVGSSPGTFNLGSTFAQIGNDSTTNYFGGIIDEVAWYAYPLTAAQIAKHYRVGKNGLSASIADSNGHIPGLAATYPPNVAVYVDAAGNFGGYSNAT